jgi:SAM-dependent methyltransferase
MSEVTCVDNIGWMEYSISIAQKALQSNLLVGAALVLNNNQLLCSSSTSEKLGDAWYDVVLRKIHKSNIFNVQSLFLTINTLSANNQFGLDELLSEIEVNEIYIGVPDPKLTRYLENDPIIKLDNIYRYPDRLQCEILKHNCQAFVQSKQYIENIPYYLKNRISDLVMEELLQKGIVVSKSELNKNKQKSELALLIHQKCKIDISEAISIVDDALSQAFNHKYGAYQQADDARSIALDWKECFMSFYRKIAVRPLASVSILNIGVGSGQEAIDLFLGCVNIDFVDIAQDGLQTIKEYFPLSKTIASSATDLCFIPDNSYDMYVSLRTYNSSFFDIRVALLEAYRVLRLKSIIILSVANGFLYQDKQCIVPGLILPGTEFIDIYRSFSTVKCISAELAQVGFRNIQTYHTNTEIYISANKV